VSKKVFRDVGNTIVGDSIYVECRKYTKWQIFQMSGQHKGSCCRIEKNAKAKILKAHTNVKK